MRQMRKWENAKDFFLSKASSVDESILSLRFRISHLDKKAVKKDSKSSGSFVERRIS